MSPPRHLRRARLSVHEVAENLGISVDLLYQWRRQSHNQGEIAFPGQGNMALTPDQKRIRELEKKLKDTKAFVLLQGYLNLPAAEMEQLEEMIICLLQLLIDFPELAELDMNPVLIKDGNLVAVDARILDKLSGKPVC